MYRPPRLCQSLLALVAIGAGCAPMPTAGPVTAPAAISSNAAVEHALQERRDQSAAWLPERWREAARIRRIPGTGVALLAPADARLGAGVVELGGGLTVELSLAHEPAASLAEGLREGAVALGVEGGIALRTPPPRALADLGGGGLLVLVELGDVTAVFRAAAALPAPEARWARVAALLATARRVPDHAPLLPAELGFEITAATTRFAAVGPEGVRFSSALLADVGARRFEAGLHRLTVPVADPAARCAPEALLGFGESAGARVLAAGERPLGGLPGCEAAAIASGRDGARFEYAALGFDDGALAEIHVSIALPADERGPTADALEEARRFADGYGLRAPDARRTPSPGP